MKAPMDDRERIARLEATVDAHSAQFDRIEQALARLQEHTDCGFRKLRDHHAISLRDLRDHNDSAMRDLRDHNDMALRDLRDHTETGFAEMRREMTRMTRWMVGICVTYGIAIVGILAKIAWGA